MSWRQTATYCPKVLLVTIAALLPYLGWAAQPWVAEGPSPLSGAGSHSAGILSPTAIGTDSQAVCGTWLYDCLMPTCFLWGTHLHQIQPRPQVKVIFQHPRPDASAWPFFCLFTQVHLLIDGSVEGRYATLVPFDVISSGCSALVVPF